MAQPRRNGAEPEDLQDVASRSSSDADAPARPSRARGQDGGGAAALVVAHPGHELRVHRWLEMARPRVFVLTDGSGHGERGRLDSTAKVIECAGASCGSIFGRFSDRDAYRLILDRSLGAFTTLILELAGQLEETGVHIMVSDAVEGFNPVHDLCFVIAEGAAELLSRRLGHPVRHYDFLLEAAPGATSGSNDDRALRIELDDGAWHRKMTAAWDYGMLRQEVERATDAHGSDAFRVEVLRPAVSGCELADRVGDPPFYETHGERRVADGVYQRALRFREHFSPLAEAVRSWAAQA